MVSKRLIECARRSRPNRQEILWATLLSASFFCQVSYGAGQHQDASRSFSQFRTSPPGRIAASPQHYENGVATLELDRPVEREIVGAQTHSYEMQLSSSQFASVTIQQLGIDVLARLFGPDGQLIAEVDADSRPVGQEVVEFVAAATGPYRIEVKARYESLPAGRYEIRIAELRPATERDNSLDEARRLHARARREFQAGKYDQAAGIEKQSLQIREQVLGSDHLVVAFSLLNLGLFQRNAGDVPAAEASYLRALAIREKALPPDHPDIALVLHNLGYLYYSDLHDYVRAQSLYERSLAIKEHALGADHPLVASTLVNMGLVQWKAKDYLRAAAYFHRAQKIFEKTVGPASDDVAKCVHNMGIVFKESGDYAMGEALYREALQIWERIFGKDHPSVALALESLGILYRDKGDYQNAEPILHRALDIELKSEGANHPDVANTLVILARMYEAKGDTTRAVEMQSRAAAIEEKNISLNLSLGSERQKLAYFSSMMNQGNRRISLHVRSAPADPKARDLALTMVLQRKGRVLDALADTVGALRTRLGAQDQTLLDQLNDATVTLARIVLDGLAGGETAAEHEKKFSTLQEQLETLEDEISRRSAGLYQPSHPVTLDAVRKALPENGALIEFAVYHPNDPKTAVEHETGAEPHYVAYVIRRRDEVQWKELGPAKEIDARIAAWRDALRDPARKDTRELGRAVDEKLMQPLRVLLGQSEHLLISPDGPLNLIPFAALIDEQGKYLIQEHTLSYLTSGRDLLRLQARRDSKGPPVVIADPAFGEPSLIPSVTGARDRTEPNRRARVDYSRPFFGPLPGAAGEVRTLRELIPLASFLTKEQATKAALKKLSGPSILHIATHGFFLAESQSVELATAATARGPKESLAPKAFSSSANNPLLRSGLALAGANQGNDGILTALEASGLNLWGTRLVTLSACDTGLGEVKDGEGVYGMRRALVLAGAESQMMSLWPVSDRSTRDLIAGYYRALLNGAGRSQALRRTQLQMMKLKPHPYYWASFIQAGEWANLEGKR
jgi:CHAT domain-containing protein/Tfp pilus assembly protein PilF